MYPQSISPTIPPTEWVQTQCFLDKTQDIIVELLINSTEIYLVHEELSQIKENYINDSQQSLEKGLKETS